MVNSLKNDEKKAVITSLIKYVNIRCNLIQYEEYIQNNFSAICKKNTLNCFLEIINDFYMNKDNYVVFKNYLTNNSIDKYIKDNFKKLLLIDDDENFKYHICMNNININRDNFVKNGSLVFKINRIIDYNIDIKERLMIIKQLDEYLKKIEKQMSTILYVNVRVLYNDTIIPPQN